jgi:hypothetical protein
MKRWPAWKSSAAPRDLILRKTQAPPKVVVVPLVGTVGPGA